MSDPDPGSRPETHTITPHIVVQNAADAAEWYAEVFGASERGRLKVPDGRLMQVELRFGDSPVMLSDEFPEMGVSRRSASAVQRPSSTSKLTTPTLRGSEPLPAAPRSGSRCKRRSGESCTGRSPIHSATGGESRSTSARCRPKSLSAQLPTHSAASRWRRSSRWRTHGLSGVWPSELRDVHTCYSAPDREPALRIGYPKRSMRAATGAIDPRTRRRIWSGGW